LPNPKAYKRPWLPVPSRSPKELFKSSNARRRLLETLASMVLLPLVLLVAVAVVVGILLPVEDVAVVEVLGVEVKSAPVLVLATRHLLHLQLQPLLLLLLVLLRE
jgi:hypothetical protein